MMPEDPMMSRDAMLPVPHRGQEGRIPPQAVEVEQAVLGAMLIEPEAIPRAIEILQPGSFYSDRHNKIYEAIRSLFDRTNPVDIITVTDELKRREELETIGGAYYVSELTAKVANAANVEYHARIIAEKSLLRQMIDTMGTLIGKAYDPGSDAFELLDSAESDIFQISESQLKRAASSMKDVLKDTLTRLEGIHGREGGVTGVPSGFTKLDQMTAGWQPSDLVILAARPSMGKTAFALACARNAALHPKTPTGVAIFSLEMSAQQLAQRMLTSEARVDAQAARTGRLRDEDWPRMARAAGRLSEAAIFIDDTPGLSALELRAKCRRLKAEHDIGLVIVDYLQLMHGSSNNKNSNREQEIAHISRSLKALAKELDVPVLALSQLSRAVETRGGDKRPQLSDLRESGSIEQDADVVGFIYRAERYGITVDENGNSTEGMAELLIGKQRNGPIGDVRLAFVHQFARFENLNSYYQGVPGGGLPGDEPGPGGDGFGSGGGGFDEPPPF
ncbi:MAG: replicative DNA helicase [Rhodothermales bacterium]|nr:replicative DNA helicase [Rhodothermales bacterium]